jgi:hypothetical protein
MEMSPKVKCPDQTDAAIIPLVHETSTVLVIPTKWRNLLFLDRGTGVMESPLKLPRIGSLAYNRSLDAQIFGHGESKCEAGGNGVSRD